MADDTTTLTTDAGRNARAMAVFGTRFDQAFPTLTHAEIERIKRFGQVNHYQAGDALLRTGEPVAGMYVVLAGHIMITQRDGLGHQAPIVEQGPGQFLAEVGQLSGRAALVDAFAEEPLEALLIPPEGLHRLLMAEAELGERIVRALILRRVNLIEQGVGGPVIVGSGRMGSVAALQNFLVRNGQPHHLLDPESDTEARDLIARLAPDGKGLPLVVAPDGTVLFNPTEADLAGALHMFNAPAEGRIYDVAVVGAGPAGLATAVYGASEGLTIAVLDRRAYGGQAGASARIENYLGFPTGISGQALAGRAYVQAQKFGAEPMIPLAVKQLDCSNTEGSFALHAEGGQVIRARSIVVASGARYRRPDVARLSEFESRGVWYWASPVEGRLCAGEEVILVGGGNSAGQAAVFLSGHARKVKMLVRGDGLAASMSKYLIERIEGTPNIEVINHAEVTGLDGDPAVGLSEVTWRKRQTGETVTEAIANLFLFAGAEPATEWLADCGVETDRAGFVITGVNGAANLESTVPGVFAVGDVRSGSVKRVGGAIGEGAQVVAALHVYLADSPVTGA